MKKALVITFVLFLLLNCLPIGVQALPTAEQNQAEIMELQQEISELKEQIDSPLNEQEIMIADYYKNVTDHAINSILLIITGASVLLTILTIVGSIAVPFISTNKIVKIEKEASVAKEAADEARKEALKAKEDLESRIMDLGRSAQEARDFSKIARAETIASEGLVWYLMEEYERALKSYNEALELNEKEPRFYFYKGNIFYEQSKYEEAIEQFDKAIELNPYQEKAYYNRGRAYCDLTQYVNAIEDYNKSIELNPNNEKAYFNRARTYEKIGKSEQAEKDYETYQALVKNKRIDTKTNPLLCKW